MPILIAKPAACTAPAVDARLNAALRQIFLIGLAAVLAIPAARGYSVWLGWMPFYLLALPHSADTGPRRIRRRPQAQARRRALRIGPQRLPRAA